MSYLHGPWTEEACAEQDVVGLVKRVDASTQRRAEGKGSLYRKGASPRAQKKTLPAARRVASYREEFTRIQLAF
jgi:hypothetical protein